MGNRSSGNKVSSTKQRGASALYCSSLQSPSGPKYDGHSLTTSMYPSSSSSGVNQIQLSSGIDMIKNMISNDGDDIKQYWCDRLARTRRPSCPTHQRIHNNHCEPHDNNLADRGSDWPNIPSACQDAPTVYPSSTPSKQPSTTISSSLPSASSSVDPSVLQQASTDGYGKEYLWSVPSPNGRWLLWHHVYSGSQYLTCSYVTSLSSTSLATSVSYPLVEPTLSIAEAIDDSTGRGGAMVQLATLPPSKKPRKSNTNNGNDNDKWPSCLSLFAEPLALSNAHIRHHYRTEIDPLSTLPCNAVHYSRRLTHHPPLLSKLASNGMQKSTAIRGAEVWQMNFESIGYDFEDHSSRTDGYLGVTWLHDQPCTLQTNHSSLFDEKDVAQQRKKVGPEGRIRYKYIPEYWSLPSRDVDRHYWINAIHQPLSHDMTTTPFPSVLIHLIFLYFDD
jgi:hypothetical protein